MKLIYVALISISLFSTQHLYAANSTADIPTNLASAIAELSDTKLQFNCESNDFKVQKTFYERPSSISSSTIDVDGNIIESKTAPYLCPDQQIELSTHCVQVMCVKTISLTPEEAMKREAQAINKLDSLLAPQNELLNNLNLNGN